jgi:DNA (cytosine-5)-methyltransferase 1
MPDPLRILIGMTVCSGIGAPEYAAPWIDWRWQSEIEPFPCAVLRHRFPRATNLGDMTRFQEWPDATVDVLCGGTPCQSFSVAGLRKGLADPRGNLMLTYLAIADRFRPRWLVWENVPGVLSSNGGRDFGSFLGGMAQLGYGFAYRVLDAQFVRSRSHPRAVPQRRRRVFVVGYLGDWRRAAAVLFDGESLSGNPPPRREAGKRPAPNLAERTRGGGGLGTDFDCDGGFVANSGPVGYCLTASAQQSLDAETETETLIAVAHSLRGEGFDAGEDGTGRGTPLVPVAFSAKDYGADAGETAPTLRAMGHANSHANGGGQIAIAIQERAVSENPDNGPQGSGVRQDGAAFTLEARNKVQAVAFDLRGRDGGAMPEGPHDTASMRAASGGSSRSYVAQEAEELIWAVRRLTPTECERLQGFPDGWTDVPHRGKPAADGPRYKALGNSWAVNCGEWIFDRIREVESRAAAAQWAGEAHHPHTGDAR